MPPLLKMKKSVSDSLNPATIPVTVGPFSRENPLPSALTNHRDRLLFCDAGELFEAESPDREIDSGDPWNLIRLTPA
jgi:hypothetical protein